MQVECCSTPWRQTRFAHWYLCPSFVIPSPHVATKQCGFVTTSYSEIWMWSREFRSSKCGAMHSTTGSMQKSGPYPFDIRSLAIWKAKNPKERTIGTCNKLEYPARREIWLKWFHVPDQMPPKYCVISSEGSPDEHQLFRISKVPPNENNSLDQGAETSSQSPHKNLLSWCSEDSGRGHLSRPAV